MHPDLQGFIDLELLSERAHLDQRQSETRRHQGVCWSGMSPDPFEPRAEAEIIVAAKTRLAAFRARRSDNALLQLACDIQRLAQSIHRSAEEVRASCNRDPRHRTSQLDQTVTDLWRLHVEMRKSLQDANLSLAHLAEPSRRHLSAKSLRLRSRLAADGTHRPAGG